MKQKLINKTELFEETFKHKILQFVKMLKARAGNSYLPMIPLFLNRF